MPLDTFLAIYSQAVALRAMHFPRRVYLGEGIEWSPKTSFWNALRHPVTTGPKWKKRRRRAMA
jgi:hypothetical protein